MMDFIKKLWWVLTLFLTIISELTTITAVSQKFPTAPKMWVFLKTGNFFCHKTGNHFSNPKTSITKHGPRNLGDWCEHVIFPSSASNQGLLLHCSYRSCCKQYYALLQTIAILTWNITVRRRLWRFVLLHRLLDEKRL